MEKTEKKEKNITLINISNHAPSKWAKEQIQGIYKIIYIPFPNILVEYGTEDINNLADNILNVINKILEKEIKLRDEIYIMLQGEYTFCYMLYDKIKYLKETKYNKYILKFAIPVTERIVKEEIQADGTVNKVSQFKFSGWRIF